MPPDQPDLFTEIENIKQVHGNDTRAMVRETAMVLFFRYGETPNASRIYQLLRKGSMTTIQDAIKSFWDDIRNKTQLRLVAPGVPQSLLDILANFAVPAWQLAQEESRKTFADLRVELETQLQAHIEHAEQRTTDALQNALRLEQAAEDARHQTEQEREARYRAEQRASELQAELATRDESIAQLNNRLESANTLLQAQRGEAEKDRSALLNQIASITNERTREREMIEGLRKRSLADVETARSDAMAAKKELQAVRGEVDRERSRGLARNEALSKEIAMLREEISTLKQRLEGASGREVAQKETMERLREDRLKLQNKVESLIQENGRLSAEVEKIPTLARQIEALQRPKAEEEDIQAAKPSTKKSPGRI